MTRIKEQLWMLAIGVIGAWILWHIGQDLMGGLMFLRELWG